MDFSLCGSCWRQTPFIDGLCCDACGCPLPGGADEDAGGVLCDDCLTIARPWSRGRAALQYRDFGRRITLALKHGDRTDLARAAAPWLKRAAAPIWPADPILVPIPLHWTRLLRRKYNQSALLADALSRLTGARHYPDALIRPKRTKPLDGHTRDARFGALDAAIRPHPKQGHILRGRNVVLVDDVMTSGATFAAATEACFTAGAADVCVLALARVAKDT